MNKPLPPNDMLRRLRLATQARIGLGRAGDGLPTRPLLDFQMAHAMARDAVHTGLSDSAVAAGLTAAPIRVASQAPDRAVYLQRPDLGRRLDKASAQELDALAMGACDAVIIIADGLSALAVHRHGAALASALAERLAGWRLAPLVVAHQARVALADDIGQRLGATLSVILIGERPGLS
ncbi:MAG TPA: ethanolamine ammonia-lyase subunit EutC, partial [Roseateles sp.]|nr:ethanolamine ammonia-lyase subunit EutC [Roseateles sp.]